MPSTFLTGAVTTLPASSRAADCAVPTASRSPCQTRAIWRAVHVSLEAKSKKKDARKVAAHVSCDLPSDDRCRRHLGPSCPVRMTSALERHQRWSREARAGRTDPEYAQRIDTCRTGPPRPLKQIGLATADLIAVPHLDESQVGRELRRSTSRTRYKTVRPSSADTVPQERGKVRRFESRTFNPHSHDPLRHRQKLADLCKQWRRCLTDDVGYFGDRELTKARPTFSPRSRPRRANSKKMLKSPQKTIYEALGREPVHPFPGAYGAGYRISGNAGGLRPPPRTRSDDGIWDRVGCGARQGSPRIRLHRDPLAVLISKFGTRPTIRRLSAKPPKKFYGRQGVSSATYRKKMLTRLALMKRLRDFVTYWFDPQARRQLTALAACIDCVRQGITRNVLWCAYSRLIITKQAGASLARDLAHSRPHRFYAEPRSSHWRSFCAPWNGASDKINTNATDRGPAARCIWAMRVNSRSNPLLSIWSSHHRRI